MTNAQTRVSGYEKIGTFVANLQIFFLLFVEIFAKQKSYMKTPLDMGVMYIRFL